MATVLHISATASVWWVKTAKGWIQSDGLNQGPVWVVTELAEETFVEITVPRIFGSDRRNFVQRQLASHFPDSSFRIALPARSAGGIMERLAPPAQTLTAVEPADRIQNALKSLEMPLAGVWSTSMLLTQLGQKSSLPPDLFIVMCESGGLRILFLKQRAPVLTRLVATPPSVPEQAAEIVRTLRHLENTRVIERSSQRYGVLVIGGAQGLPDNLKSERLDVLPLPPSWGHASTLSWNHLLFDQVCKNPPGQLAPMSYRASYLARTVDKAARVGTALSLAVALWLTSGNISDSVQAQRDVLRLQAAISQVSAQIAKVNLAIEAYGVSPDLVRKALAVDSEEIASAPDLGGTMVRLSAVVGAAPGVRLNGLQWHMLAGDEVACTPEAGGSAATAPATEPAAGQRPSRKVELQMTVLFADGIGPRLLEHQAREFSRQLAQMEGAVLINDPARRLREDVINAGTTQGAVSSGLVWCVTLPGAVATPNQPTKVGAP